ncbi:MAG: nucleoside triphosphate pyrophosphohydrolase [Oscillospiraceae bacterium]|nr:nucleoside triphosphate pyrophosphohydrolase [Oscillospiraceae bacterium]
MRTSEETLARLRDCPHYGIAELLEIMQVLRSENGCPWDKEQSHQSIRQDFLEETYEVIEAINMDSVPMLREELGDVLLQVVFHCQIEAEQAHFTFGDVCDEVCRKLVIRHPHVFGDVTAETSEQVLKNWDSIKQETKHQETAAETLESVCKALPALMYAQKLGKRAGRAGMDWKNAEDAFRYIRLETDELEAAMQQGDQQAIEDELGDLLFSCVNTARHLHIDAETALNGASAKFLRRFAETERLVRADGLDMAELPIETLDTYWMRAKQSAQQQPDPTSPA